MAFMDDLGLVEVLIGLVAVLFCYVGLLSWWYIRTNNAEELKKLLRASSLPVGVTGAIGLIMGLWTEFTWPYNVTIPINGVPTNVLGGYNIFFGDAMVLFGLVACTYAAAAYVGHHLHVTGVLALVTGAALAFYGWTGYGAAGGGFTKDPLDTFLMYGAFALAGVLAFPATVITDWYLNAAAKGRTFWQKEVSDVKYRLPMGARAAQPISKVTTEEETSSTSKILGYRMPLLLQLMVLAFPIAAALASIAAFWYFGVTLPGHLGGGASAAP